MTYTMDAVRALREATGAGVMDVKQALEEAAGDSERALDALRKKGKHVAAKKADRTAREGTVGSYVHANGKVAALVALACETDFVARNNAFKELAHDLALHVAALNPQYLTSADIPEAVLEKEREIALAQMAGEHKPQNVLEKIAEGKLAKFASEHCLLQQAFVKDDSITVAELIEQAIGKLGEKIEVRQFIRFQL